MVNAMVNTQTLSKRTRASLYVAKDHKASAAANRSDHIELKTRPRRVTDPHPRPRPTAPADDDFGAYESLRRGESTGHRLGDSLRRTFGSLRKRRA